MSRKTLLIAIAIVAVVGGLFFLRPQDVAKDGAPGKITIASVAYRL